MLFRVLISCLPYVPSPELPKFGRPSIWSMGPFLAVSFCQTKYPTDVWGATINGNKCPFHSAIVVFWHFYYTM